MVRKGTTPGFWRRMNPDSLNVTAKNFSEEVPQASGGKKVKAPLSEIRPVKLVEYEYRGKCLSAELESEFRPQLESLLNNLSITEGDSAALLAEKIHAQAQQLKPSVISCRVISKNLYFVFNPRKDEYGFYYVPVDIIFSLKQKTVNEPKS